MIRTAILVDGGFYRRRATHLWGKKTPEERVKELSAYCNAHIKDTYELKDERYLYRIFYYDCPPISKNVYHPLTQKMWTSVKVKHTAGHYRFLRN